MVTLVYSDHTDKEEKKKIQIQRPMLQYIELRERILS